MGNRLYIIAIVLFMSWFIGYFMFHAGGQIHMLLIALVAVALVQAIPPRRMA
jgi:hypothetical protein